ncbi:MAG: hypothetical protein K8R58_08645 [Bacteroidales bacterium]|nr:hypothetical protein [Bacteroidales bacterium]
MFYGSVIARFFGVLVVWTLRFLYSLITGKKIKAFIEIWKGPDYDDLADNASYEMKFIIIGVVFIFVTCWLLMKVHL